MSEFRSIRNFVPTFALSVALAVAASGATAAGGTTGSTANKLNRADSSFVKDAAMGSMAEVALGDVAQKNASSDQVKQFGARMVQDHSKANDELKQVASSKGVDLPSALDRKHQSEVDRMSKLSGAQFERAYMSHMVGDHKKDVSEFKKAAKSAKDADVKSFASKTLPTLEEHLRLAQTTNDAVRKTK